MSSIELDIGTIEGSIDEIEIPCDTCQAWINWPVVPTWPELLPARWIARVTDHQCLVERRQLLVCDFHIRWKNYHCGQCKKAPLSLVVLDKL